MIFRDTTKSVLEEQQLRFAFLQVGQVIVLASGSIVNFGVSDPFQEQFCWWYSLFSHSKPARLPNISFLLAHPPTQTIYAFIRLIIYSWTILTGEAAWKVGSGCFWSRDWYCPFYFKNMKPSHIHSEQVTCVIGIVTYLWIVDFPENAYRSFCFMSKAETELAVSRIQHDRGDVIPEPFSWSVLLENFLDIKIYGFAACLFLLVGWMLWYWKAVDWESSTEHDLCRTCVLLADNVRISVLASSTC